MTYQQMGGRGITLALFFILLILLNACREPTTVSNDVIGALDQRDPVFTDTLTIETLTQRDDSLVTSRQLLHYIGTVDDPDMGKTYAALHAQVRLPSNNIDLGDSLSLDSLILQFRYARVFGDGSVPQTFKVYQLTEDMNPLEGYLENRTFSFDPVEIGKATVVEETADTNLLRIRLSDAIGQYLLDQSGGAVFENNDAFLSTFKGLLIAPDTSNGYAKGLFPVSTVDVLSNMTLHYASGSEDSLRFVFPINATSATHGYYQHQYDQPAIARQLNQQVSTDSIAFAQGLGGLLTQVNIPHIRTLGDISIMKAELVITQRPLGSDTTYEQPPDLVIRVRDRDTMATVFQTLFDENYDQQQVFYDFGGNREETFIDGKRYYQYRFNLLRHLQFVADNRLNNLPLLIKVLPSTTAAERLSMGGGQHPNENLRMKLNLFYIPK